MPEIGNNNNKKKKKNKNWKRQAMMAYMDSGYKNSRPTTTNWARNWVNAYKSQPYPNGWRSEKLS